MNENYIPYGPEWEKEMSKLKKSELIGQLRKAYKNKSPDAGEGKEMLEVGMALCRTGWQMACDELLTYCNDKKVSPVFIDQIFSMMDKEKKRQFSWETLKKEMESMGVTPR